LKNIDSIEECKEEIKKIVQVIASGKVKYSSPVFRTLGVAAATAEEKEGFLEKIAEQIDSIATDVSTVESTITMSDLDEIDSIKEAVTELEKSQDKLVRDVHDVRDDIRKILNKLELR
jgi:archaellum component FlaC